jgi:hypothetical protein
MPDLFDFFKDQESKLHERPSEEVWKKLETKLNKTRRPKRRGIRFMQLGTIVVILLFLLLAAILVWHYARKDGQGRGVAPKPATEQPVESPGKLSGRVSGATTDYSYHSGQQGFFFQSFKCNCSKLGIGEQGSFSIAPTF